MSRFVPRIISFYLLLLAAGGTANAQSTFEQKAANPFDNNNDGLPDLGMALMNPLMILVKIIKLRWIHILSYDQ
ncbi:hypothetical protein OFC21_23580, partial [Escherichia coli]|nr:hypothetical protein [Escherichia coli]